MADRAQDTTETQAVREAPFRDGFPGIGVAVTAVVQSDNASRSVRWNPADCSELRVNVRVVEGEPEIAETCQ